jgi:outer membrane protein assembly factor BamB
LNGSELKVFSGTGEFVRTLLLDCEECTWLRPFTGVDPTPDGGLVCSGSIETLEGDTEVRLIKFDAAGEEAWLFGSGMEWHESFDAVVAPDGSVVLTALVLSPGPEQFRQLTLKLDASGQELWRVWRNQSEGNWGVQAALDPTQNVISIGPLDFVKYDVNGTQLWRRERGHPRLGVTTSSQVSVDAAGEIYLLGTRWNDPESLVLEKFDAAGQTLWIATIGGCEHIESRPDLKVDGAKKISISWLFDGLISVRLTQPEVTGAPHIVRDPEPVSSAVRPGESVTLRAEVTGLEPLELRWWYYANGVLPTPVPNATGAVLVLPDIGLTNAGSYYLEARNANGYTASYSSVVEVGSPPTFTLHDSMAGTLPFASVNEMGALRLAVYQFTDDSIAEGWQWYHDGDPIAGATNQFLHIVDATTASAGTYKVVGTNKFGASTANTELRVYAQVRIAAKTRLTLERSQFRRRSSSACPSLRRRGRHLLARHAGVVPGRNPDLVFGQA